MLRLEHDSLLAIEWFENNFMKLNEDKCHYLLSGYKHEILWSRVGKAKIWESSEQKLLGVVVDRDLKLDTHVSSICKKAGIKLNFLTRVSKYLDFKKKIVIHKSTVALCLTLCLFFRTFFRKYAYSCYAYKKKLVYAKIT